MKLKRLLIFAVLLVLPNINANQEVSFVKHWKDILLTDGEHSPICALSIDGCARSAPYNVSKKIMKASVNASEKDSIPEKSIDNFDEWTKKRRDAVANQNGQNQKTIEPTQVARHDEVSIPLPPITRPPRNFASRECGAKIIAANPEAENAKAVVNEKDVDDYMRNPCQSAKEKFIVIELCEAIQIKKIAIGNFELFASRPKTIQVFISERYPPLANWISVGPFHLQDHHKNLQTFDVPNTNVYAKYVRINLEDHYGKEHYCIVSVVNVMGSTLADEYDKEEAAAHLLNVIEEVKEEPVTTPPPSEQKMQTQLPVPPKSPNQTVSARMKSVDFRQLKSVCSQCSVGKVSNLICHILPIPTRVKKNDLVKPPNNLKTSTIKPAVTDKRDLKTEIGLWAERSRHSNFEQSRRRNLATIQRLHPKDVQKISTAPDVPTPKAENIEKPTEKPSEEVKPPAREQPQVSLPPKPKSEPILPAGGSTNQRELVLMKLSKRIAAVELNLTLSSEYLSELSKQYVSQMSGYQQELKETRKASKKTAQTVEAMMRSKMNGVKRELRDLRQSVYLLQKLENSRYNNVQSEMSRQVLMSSCHISSNVPPSPTIARLPLIIPALNRKLENFTNFEERMKKIYETAKSVMFGSLTWNTDHLIVALISFNIMALSFLFAGVFYIHRRNKERCEETQIIVKNELRARIAKVGIENRKLISKGMRRAELAVTAAVSSALKIEKTSSNRSAMTELETALANLFEAQQTRIEEQFEQNQKMLRDALSERNGSRPKFEVNHRRMPSCTTPTYGVSTQLESQSSESPSRSSVMTPTSLDGDNSPRKRFPIIDNVPADRWPSTRRDGWSSVRAPPPARLTLSTNNRHIMSPISSAYSQTPNSLLSPAMFNPKSRSIFSPTLPATPMSYGKSSMDKSLFSPTATEPIEVEATVEYLADLVKEKKHLTLFPHMFSNVERLLDDEIGRVRVALFQTEFPRVELPEPAGDMISITEKIYVPKNEYPDYNFVGRILGPRGMTAKQLEQDTGCKIMVRGKGSMRDKSKESAHRGKANWEHLEDDLHVLVQCEDTENRVHIKLQAALEQVKKLLIPAPEGTDELKRKQLMELAIINGTYRPMKSPNPARVMTAVPLLSPTPLRSSGPVLMSPTPGSGLPSTTFGGSILSPTLTASNLLGSNVFDYSLLSPSMFDSFSSLQLASDLTFPKYPTTTSFVNSFPGLFTSASSFANQTNTNVSPSGASPSASSVNNTSF